MLCSLLNVSPNIMQHVIIWAMDEDAARDLLSYAVDILKQSGLSFGVYFDERFTANQELVDGWGNSTSYFQIMDIRRLVSIS